MTSILTCSACGHTIDGRGALCNTCNAVIGMLREKHLEEWGRKADRYLSSR